MIATRFQCISELAEHLENRSLAEAMDICEAEHREAAKVFKDRAASLATRRRLHRYEREVWLLREYLQHDRQQWAGFPHASSFEEIARRIRGRLRTDEQSLNKVLHVGDSDSAGVPF